jgi:hypothetical protein
MRILPRIWSVVSASPRYAPERAELYHLRATQQISNETMQKLLLRDLDLMEALLVEKEDH